MRLEALRGADLRTRSVSSLTWWARVGFSSDEELIFALLSPCCSDSLSQVVTRATAQQLPCLGRGPVPYEHFICTTCAALLPPTPGIERDTARWTPSVRGGDECVLVLSSWAEVCLDLEPLTSHLWAADMFGQGIALAARGRFVPVLREIRPPR